jgi:hypothetical protein
MFDRLEREVSDGVLSFACALHWRI